MKLGIIIGSVRQGRNSSKQAKWIAAEAQKNAAFDTQIVDLKDYNLPMFDEAISPKYNQNRQTTGEVKRWLDTIAELDAYIIVTPEYDRSIPGALKNAIDYLAYEMKGKIVGIATHGSNNGAQALTTLRYIIPELGALSTPAFVGLPYMLMSEFGEDGEIAEEKISHFAGQLQGLLADVELYGQALLDAQK